eukprot:234962-Pleurochrysis_carterae.AAC.2
MHAKVVAGVAAGRAPDMRLYTKSCIRALITQRQSGGSNNFLTLIVHSVSNLPFMLLYGDRRSGASMNNEAVETLSTRCNLDGSGEYALLYA